MYLHTNPHKQGAISKTFKAPPLDGSLSVPEILDWQGENSPNHRIFVYAREDGTKISILWPEFIKACHAGARSIYNLTAGEPGQVVGILAPSESISYATLVFATMRANSVVFPISPRNSAPAVAHLISAVNVKYLLVGREQAMFDLANHALEILSKKENAPAGLPTMSPIPLFEDLFLGERPEIGEQEPAVAFNRKPDDPAFYIHSSGSTAFPKPIVYTHRRYLQIAVAPWFGDRDLADSVVSFAAIPMFHGMGLIGSSWVATCGLIISAFEPKYPAVIPTAAALFRSARATRSDYLFSVPSLIEAWSREPEYVKWMATRSGILFGGGPLNKQVGDYLVSQGVSIFVTYGIGEAGLVSKVLPATVDRDWEYFPFCGSVTPEMKTDDGDKFELVLVENAYNRPSVINAKVDGRDGYATSDLLVRHPNKSGYWKIYGRADDQIMHSTGEKTNPGPLEGMMNQHPKVLASVMFGRGKFQAGIIVDPQPEFRFDPEEDTEKLAAFRNELWPTVQKMNEYAPQHSRLFKEMIIISKPSKPFTYTGKSTARRQAIIAEYDDEIERLYKLVDESVQTSILPPTEWDSRSTLRFVKQVVVQVMASTSIKEDDDLFEHGCDSLQATWIRNTLLRALRDSTRLDIRNHTHNFVYQHSTISRLSTFVQTVISGHQEDASITSEKELEEMMASVRKYMPVIPSHRPTSSSPSPQTAEKDVVILVGSTGGVGSHLLVALTMDESVEHIYALNRHPPTGTTSLMDRQKRVFQERDLPLDILQSSKISLLTVDIGADAFGLEPSVFDQMHKSATHVIHNAWRVDFNLGLTSFESSLKTMQKTLELALSSPRQRPPRYLFVSSIGVLRDLSGYPRPIQETQVPASVAVGNGYAESKWVVEEILAEVARKTHLQTLVVRLGQVAGAPNGAWNVKEWFPSLVQASARLGCVPEFGEDKLVSWVPAQQVADVLTQLRDADGVRLCHLVHPNPINWSTVCEILARELGLEIVSYGTWLERLEGYTGELNASLLLPFFRSVTGNINNDREAFGLPELDASTVREKYSESFRTSKLREDDIKSWITYWREVGCLQVS